MDKEQIKNVERNEASSSLPLDAGSPTLIIADNVEDPCNVGDYRLNLAGKSLDDLWRSCERLERDAKRLRSALSDYYWDLIRLADGMPTIKTPMELATAAEIVLRETEYLANDPDHTRGS